MEDETHKVTREVSMSASVRYRSKRDVSSHLPRQFQEEPLVPVHKVYENFLELQ